MINEFLHYIQYEKNYSSHTVLSYHTDLKEFADFLQITPQDFHPEKVEPPTMATMGRSGLSMALPRASSSPASRGPAQATGANWATP
jgi:site-specific recombinase XerD